MTKYRLAATGGTFDIVHRGHLALLGEAFDISSRVIIGLVGDIMAQRRGKRPQNSYDVRRRNLEYAIRTAFGDTNYMISPLNDDFGPAVFTGELGALVVSQETARQGDILNRMRREKNLPPVDIIIVPMILAEDGTRISSSRIRASEMDAAGHVLGGKKLTK